MERTSPLTTQTETRLELQPWLMVEPAWYDQTAKLESLAANFDPICLADMDAVALLDRIDSKYVLTMDQLLCALEDLRDEYWILSIDGKRLHQYRTLYFDTSDFALFHAHVNGRAERYKVRSREYIDSGLAFLEVKHKTRKNRTVKERVRTAKTVLEMSEEYGDWLTDVYPMEASRLAPKLRNSFIRITLVSKQSCERVTLDVDLEFSTADRIIRLDQLVIAEVKIDRCSQSSPFTAQMRKQRIRQRGFSKYSVGVGMLVDGVKKNALKPTLLMVEKMIKGAALL